MSENWLDNLKVGDRVIVSYGVNSMVVSKVDRITKTMIVTEGGGRYNRTNGLPAGVSGWNSGSLLEVTEQRIKEINHDRLYKKLSKFNFKDLPLESLQGIKKIIQEQGFEL